jgi:uncharacterized Zn-binding protein involved in type VI secretion
VTVLGGPLQASISPSTDTICFGSSSELEAVVSGGVAPYSYDWSSDPAGFDSDQQTVMVSPEVTTIYMVEVTDDDGNVVTAEVTVVVNSLPVADAGPDQLICYDDPSVEVCATASANAEYGWEHASGGDFMTGQCVNLTPGTWYLAVLDTTTGCTAFDTVLIEQSEELIVTLYEDSTVEITGGTAPYDTTYENTGDTLRVTVVDVNGCTATDEVMTTAADFNTLTGVTIYPNPARGYIIIKGLEHRPHTLQIYDIHGKRVLFDNDPSNKILLNGLSSGWYQMHIKTRHNRYAVLPFLISR